VTRTLHPVTTALAAPVAACDEVTMTVDGDVRHISGRLLIRGDGPYQPHHFPGIAIFPGVFILEFVLQAAGRALGDRDGHPLSLHAVHSLRFLLPVRPGDELRVAAEVTETPFEGSVPRALLVRADCRRGDGLRVAAARLECGWAR
jgi:3-hydroxyacyl-[acyl-carrier-protein] dehydratase